MDRNGYPGSCLNCWGSCGRRVKILQLSKQSCKCGRLNTFCRVMSSAIFVGFLMHGAVFFAAAFLGMVFLVVCAVCLFRTLLFAVFGSSAGFGSGVVFAVGAVAVGAVAVGAVAVVMACVPSGYAGAAVVAVMMAVSQYRHSCRAAGQQNSGHHDKGCFFPFHCIFHRGNLLVIAMFYRPT